MLATLTTITQCNLIFHVRLSLLDPSSLYYEFITHQALSPPAELPSLQQIRDIIQLIFLPSPSSLLLSCLLYTVLLYLVVYNTYNRAMLQCNATMQIKREPFRGGRAIIVYSRARYSSPKDPLACVCRKGRKEGRKRNG